jgi:hypothetical protein
VDPKFYRSGNVVASNVWGRIVSKCSLSGRYFVISRYPLAHILCYFRNPRPFLLSNKQQSITRLLIPSMRQVNIHTFLPPGLELNNDLYAQVTKVPPDWRVVIRTTGWKLYTPDLSAARPISEPSGTSPITDTIQV